MKSLSIIYVKVCLNWELVNVSAAANVYTTDSL